MPRAAAAAGAVDFALRPYEIGHELARLGQIAARTARFQQRELAAVFRLLNSAHNVDFTHYKPSTIERRIRRRMALHRADGLGAYVALLREHPGEVEELYRDLLIRVTSFYRDPEVFEVLARDILPRLAADCTGDKPVRVWVPGCATGEEVYSLVMLLLDAAREAGVNCPVQMFGTDISEDALGYARRGLYPESISAEIAPERLRRYFIRADGGYRVAQAVRDCCVFARQDLTRDPPFSRLDLISCRNVMIYLGTALQRKVMSIFHYSLNPNGYLLLGSSETVGRHTDLFATVDRRQKIYQKKPGVKLMTVKYGTTARHEPRSERTPMAEEAAAPVNIFREADRVMLSRLSPPSVLINESMDVLQFRGRTSLFLEPPSGVASFNILKMAREGLLADLRAAIHAARNGEAPVRREGISVRTNGDSVVVDLEVIPFVTAGGERYQIVMFEQVRPARERAAAEKPRRGEKKKRDEEAESQQVERLKRELEATREYLQSIVEEQEAMNEELRAANEEIQSSNEELQSTNEELETAKEELQSSNEELTTLNEELENRNEELAQADNDLLNLLASVDLPMVMLDSGLRIRRFNPGAQRALNLVDSDVGRPINDLRTTLVLDDLEGIIRGVIENPGVREMEVRDRGGRAYSFRVHPYKTTENRVEGAVLVLIDLDQLRRA